MYSANYTAFFQFLVQLIALFCWYGRKWLFESRSYFLTDVYLLFWSIKHHWAWCIGLINIILEHNKLIGCLFCMDSPIRPILKYLLIICRTVRIKYWRLHAWNEKKWGQEYWHTHTYIENQNVMNPYLYDFEGKRWLLEVMRSLQGCSVRLVREYG